MKEFFVTYEYCTLENGWEKAKLLLEAPNLDFAWSKAKRQIPIRKDGKVFWRVAKIRPLQASELAANSLTKGA